jgi:hypothetical protein
MFGAMRSRRRRDLAPCPCNNTCRCHKRSPRADLYAVLILIGMVILLPTVFYFLAPKNTTRYIHVGDQICEVQFVETGRTSTGASWGYDKAVCPK